MATKNPVRVSPVILISAFFVLFESCSNRDRHVVPPSKMVDVLTDLHFADGMGAVVYRKDLDSVHTYRWVFDKNKITKAEFDSSMVYYSNRPDKLNQIYEKVLTNLQKRQAEVVAAQKQEQAKEKTTIYEDKTMYRLPFDRPVDKIPFEALLMGPGEYTVEANIKVLNVDQSVNPHITAYFWYENGTEEGVREYFRPVRLKKNNKSNLYSLSKRLTDIKYTHIKGFILDHDNTNNNFIMHAQVFGIKITYSK